MKVNTSLMLCVITSVIIGGCGEKVAQEKSSTSSTPVAVGEVAVKGALGVVQMSPPFDEMHLIVCKQHQNQAADSDAIRLSELVLEQQRLIQATMDANDITKMQQITIMAAKAVDTENCK